MFDLSLPELTIIFVVVLLVVGPERMPELARKAGLWIGKARKFVNSVQRDIERELRTDELQRLLNQQTNEIQELKTLLTETRADTEKALQETEYLVKAMPGESKASTEKPAELAPPGSEPRVAGADESPPSKPT
ncbi:MAG: Sec-independent protein translocase protein TatB [Thiotrichales bacterium]